MAENKSQDENVRAANEKPQGNNPTTVKTVEGWGDGTRDQNDKKSGPPNDWNPTPKPQDGSPVKTVVGSDGTPASGQTGHKPKTVAEHNAEVEALSNPAATTEREKRTRLP